MISIHPTTDCQRTATGSVRWTIGWPAVVEDCLCWRVPGRRFKAKKLLDRNLIAKHTQNHETGQAAHVKG